MTAPAGQCPRCGASHDPGQAYCLACGLRLPSDAGALARARRAWVRGVGWYPGDWVWAALLALVVAVAGAALAIVATRDASSARGGETLYLASESVPLAEPAPTAPSTADTGTLPAPPEPTGSSAAPPAAVPARGATPWPDGKAGWTVVLEALPANESGRKSAAARAGRAVEQGLPDVGVLVSARYSSLHPGYYVVFSGIYDTRADAESNLRAAATAGFSGAYARAITR